MMRWTTAQHPSIAHPALTQSVQKVRPHVPAPSHPKTTPHLTYHRQESSRTPTKATARPTARHKPQQVPHLPNRRSSSQCARTSTTKPQTKTSRSRTPSSTPATDAPRPQTDHQDPAASLRTRHRRHARDLVMARTRTACGSSGTRQTCT